MSKADGARGPSYRRIIEVSPADRAGAPDEVGAVATILMATNDAFISGSAVSMHEGVTSADRLDELKPK